MVEDKLVVKTLRQKCVNDNIRKIIMNIKDLGEMWSKMDT
jgi:hypothetical protein